MNQQLKFYKGNEANLSNVSLPEAGSIYHCEDTGNTYLANEDNVLEIYSNTFTFSAAEADAAVPVNADTLNGKTADDFMTPIQVDDAINEAVENVAYVSNLSSDSSLVLADAESLGGLPAENYATKNYVVDTINQAQLGGDNSEVDLSIYATKDDLTLVRNAIPTTPEAIGAEVSGAAENALNNAKTYTNEQINAIDYPVDSVNGKTGAVSLSAADVGARPNTWIPTADDVGAVPIFKASLANCSEDDIVEAGGYTISTANASNVTGGAPEIAGYSRSLFVFNFDTSNTRVLQLECRAAGGIDLSKYTGDLFYRIITNSTTKTIQPWRRVGSFDEAVKKSGDTMTGALTTTALTISNATPVITFNETDNKNSSYRISGNRHYLRSYASDTDYYEQFRTPTPSTGLTGNKSYDFLTTKSPVTIGQGGTGATNADGARLNLGISTIYSYETATDTWVSTIDFIKSIYSGLSGFKVYVLPRSNAGAMSFLIGMRTNDLYGVFLEVSYSGGLHMYRLVNGTWSETLISGQ